MKKITTHVFSVIDEIKLVVEKGFCTLGKAPKCEIVTRWFKGPTFSVDGKTADFEYRTLSSAIEELQGLEAAGLCQFTK